MLALSATVAFALAWQADTHHPAFFWGTQLVSEGASNLRGKEILREATSDDVERTVERLASVSTPPGAKGSPMVDGRSETPPEVQLVFLAEGLDTSAVRTHGDRLPALQSLMEKSAASLTVPFTLPSPQTRAFEHAPVRVAGHEAEQYLKSHSGLYNNGAADVVVVELAAADGTDAKSVLASHDAAIGRIARAVDAGTNGNYAALLTGAHGARGAHRKLAAKANTPYLHTTPTLLTAQLVCLILFVIFISGFCCLFSLQTPKKFEENKAA